MAHSVLIKAFNYALDRLSGITVSGLPEFQEERQIVFARSDPKRIETESYLQSSYEPDTILVNGGGSKRHTNAITFPTLTLTNRTYVANLVTISPNSTGEMFCRRQKYGAAVSVPATMEAENGYPRVGRSEKCVLYAFRIRSDLGFSNGLL